MSAVWFRARAGLRASVRFTLAVALIGGLAGGVVMAAAAAGRRTASAYDRYLVAARRDDAVVFVAAPNGETRIRALPEVAEAVGLRQVFFTRPVPASLAPAGANAAYATELPLNRTPIDRVKLVAGRFPDPDRLDEIAVGFLAAEQFHVRLGQRVVLPLAVPGTSLDEVASGSAKIAMRLEATITGIVAHPQFFPPQRVFGDIYLTPRAFREIAPRVMAFPGALVHLKRGVKDFPIFQQHVQTLAGPQYAIVAGLQDQIGSVNRSLRLFRDVLWLFAALAGAALALILGQSLARMVFLDSVEHPSLAALGMDRRQLLATSIVRALLTGAAVAAVACVTAVGLSVLGPIGRVARIADPSPGIRIDPVVAPLGAVSIVALSLLVVVVPARRAAAGIRDTAAVGGDEAPGLSRFFARSSLPPSIATGMRAALLRGRGRTATPVGTTLAAAVLSIAALVGALTFGASFNHIITTPRLYGWDWDIGIGNPYVPYGAGGALDLLRKEPSVVGLAAGTTAVQISVRGVTVNVWGLDVVRGSAVPTVIRGRWPQRDGEIALGPKTLRRLDVGLGATVPVVLGATRAPMTVVGEILPPAGGAYQLVGALGEGAGMTFSQLRRLAFIDVPNLITVRLAPGTDVTGLLRRVAAVAAPNLEIERPESGNGLEDLERAKQLPLALAGTLALAAAAAVGHALIASVRRRRRDLAILKTVGFVRSQTFVSVASQATTFATIAVLFGIPAGLIGGRWLWSVFATRTLGTLSVPVSSTLPTALVVPGALLVANLVALGPARAAARVRPAVALRTE